MGVGLSQAALTARGWVSTSHQLLFTTHAGSTRDTQSSRNTSKSLKTLGRGSFYPRHFASCAGAFAEEARAVFLAKFDPAPSPRPPGLPGEKGAVEGHGFNRADRPRAIARCLSRCFTRASRSQLLLIARPLRRTNNRVLIGTPVRLETRVTHRKQRIGAVLIGTVPMVARSTFLRLSQRGPGATSGTNQRLLRANCSSGSHSSLTKPPNATYNRSSSIQSEAACTL